MDTLNVPPKVFRDAMLAGLHDLLAFGLKIRRAERIVSVAAPLLAGLNIWFATHFFIRGAEDGGMEWWRQLAFLLDISAAVFMFDTWSRTKINLAQTEAMITHTREMIARLEKEK